MMNETEQALAAFHLPRWEEFPDMELYMDQMIVYLNQHLRPLTLTGQDIITKAMVNNYVKNSIVKPPIKKHYKNYHIGFLIVVILLKPSFTMAEISEMIEIYNHLDSKTFDRDFNHFVRSYEEALQEIFRTGRIVQKDVSDCTPEQALMISAIQTAVRHIYTQHLLSKIKKLPATADSAQ